MKSLNVVLLLGSTWMTLLSIPTFSMIIIPSDTPTGAVGSGPNGGANGINGYRAEDHGGGGGNTSKSYSIGRYVEAFGLPASEYYPGDAGDKGAVVAPSTRSAADFNRFNVQAQFNTEIRSAISLLDMTPHFITRLSFAELLQLLKGGAQPEVSDFQGITNRKEALKTIKYEISYLQMELWTMGGHNTTYLTPQQQTVSNLKEFLGNKNRISAKLAKFFKKRALNFDEIDSQAEVLFARKLDYIVNGSAKIKNKCLPLF